MPEAKDIWQHPHAKPKDGKWTYVLRTVHCTECESGEDFILANYDEEGYWFMKDEPFTQIELNKITGWMNIELFYHNGTGFDFED